MTPSLANLAAALESDETQAWLQSCKLPDSGRAVLQRVIEYDGALWKTHPDSVGSCLLARTLGHEGFDELRNIWRDELSRSGCPWVRSLQPLSLAHGLLRTLSHDTGPDISQLSRLQFLDDDTLVASPFPFHPSVQDPSRQRKDRLHWGWKTNEAKLEPNPECVATNPGESYPKFTKEGWGPCFMTRTPESRPVELPCPIEASAYGQVGVRERFIIVYGSLDEYDGGFIWFVDATSLRTSTRLETATPVWSVHESSDGSVLVAKTSQGIAYWRRDRKRMLRSRDVAEPRTLGMHGDSIALSPNGEFVAIRTRTEISVWSLEDTPTGTVDSGMPAQFSPDGRRLVRDHMLVHGTTGELVSHVPVELGGYLEGGPAHPWCFLGDRFLVNLWAGSELWTTDDGQKITAGKLPGFPHWYFQAFDARGARWAAIKRGTSQARIHEIPSGRVLTTIEFELESHQGIALSPNGRRVAIMHGRWVEVRDIDGNPVAKLQHPQADEMPAERHFRRSTNLRFVDDFSIASRLPNGGWRLFRLDDGSSEVHPNPRLGLAPGRDSQPEDWTVESGGEATVFTHRPTATKIALPVAGEWLRNPVNASVLACDGAQVVLEVPAAS